MYKIKVKDVYQHGLEDRKPVLYDRMTTLDGRPIRSLYYHNGSQEYPYSAWFGKDHRIWFKPDDYIQIVLRDPDKTADYFTWLYNEWLRDYDYLMTLVEEYNETDN